LPGEPPLILAFDTSAARCAAAVVSGGRVLAARDEGTDRGQAERLLPMLEEALAEAGVGWGDLDGIGVCTGPGNFTGVRIAVAAARGLALALGVPAVGVTAFEALAEPAGYATVAILDRRGTVFVQRFRDGEPLGEPAAGADREPLPEAAIRVDCAVLARIAARRLGSAPPPAPLYLRPADAMPPAEAPPPILDDA
jgi:tRNA threonylcarbamoyl adenosine modification protein YeaZ